MWIRDESRQRRVGSVAVDFVGLHEAAEALATGELLGAVHLCNAYTLALADERPELAAALAPSAANLPDGMPLVWWAKRKGLAASERVYGPDLMEAVLDIGQAHGTRHYLYGSTPEVLTALESAITERWPDALVVGTESPPFRELTDAEVSTSVGRASDAEADVVWVGMGTPKQDLLVHRMASEGKAAFVAVGAAFDFIAGAKPQAPRWMMRLGLEWLYRLVSEPRRLWKRYLVYNVKFVRLLYRSG